MFHSLAKENKTCISFYRYCPLILLPITLKLFLKSLSDIPGSPTVKTLCFHYRGLKFDPWLSSDGKASACNAGDLGSTPQVGKIPWRRKWQPTPVVLPGKFHGWRSLVGYSPWDRKESETLSDFTSLPYFD